MYINIYMYNWITAVHLKLIQYKSTILQFKKNINVLCIQYMCTVILQNMNIMFGNVWGFTNQIPISDNIWYWKKERKPLILF